MFRLHSLIAIIWLIVAVLLSANLGAKILTSIQYKGSAKGIKNKITQTLESLPDNRFRLQNNINSGLGSVTEYTIFKYSPSGNIIPLEYSYRLKVFFISRHQLINFDWETMQATELYKKKSKTLALEKGYQDPLSFQWQMRLDLMNGKKVMDYHVVKRHQIRHFTYQVVMAEQLQLAAKSVDTLLVERQFDPDSNREIKIWVAPELNYVTVKAIHRKKGKLNVAIEYDKILIQEDAPRRHSQAGAWER